MKRGRFLYIYINDNFVMKIPINSNYIINRGNNPVAVKLPFLASAPIPLSYIQHYIQ